jgi:hypothetical protein
VLAVLPELLPDVTGLPTAKAVIDCLPAAKVVREIAPGDAGPSLREHGFNEPPVTELRWAAGIVLQSTHNGLHLSPNSIGDDQAQCHGYSPQGVKCEEEPIAI